MGNGHSSHFSFYSLFRFDYGRNRFWQLPGGESFAIGPGKGIALRIVSVLRLLRRLICALAKFEQQIQNDCIKCQTQSNCYRHLQQFIAAHIDQAAAEYHYAESAVDADNEISGLFNIAPEHVITAENQ
jgi:hypothetical protein